MQLGNVIDQWVTDRAAIYLGDACQVLPQIPTASVNYGLHSPPFSDLYIYGDSEADLGNSKSHLEFFKHYKFVIKELERVHVPGSIHTVHCKDLPLYQGRDGEAGLYDFPGDIIRAYEECGWTFHSRRTIWKCPKIEMRRTKNSGLLYCNLRADSRGSRAGMADYLICFRKWGEGKPEKGGFPHPVSHTEDTFPLPQWQEWASPVWEQVMEQGEWVRQALRQVGGELRGAARQAVIGWMHRHLPERLRASFLDRVWMDIQQTDVLNGLLAREGNDEKHICPIQRPLVRRCLTLYSRPGDVVLDCFNGIGTTGTIALEMGRYYVGIELKRSYWEHSVRFCKTKVAQPTMAGMLDLAA